MVITNPDSTLNNNEKPKFLTKEERAKIAIENRIKEVNILKEKQEQERLLRESYFKKAENESKKSKHKDRRSRSRDRNKRKRSRSKDRKDQHSNNKEKNSERILEDKELAAIKKRYIGGEKEVKKVRKQWERKFVFDWDKNEDTTQFKDNYNPLAKDFEKIASTSERPITLFGKGRLAGYDPDIVKNKDKKNLYDDRKRYKSSKLEDLSWRDKKLTEMTTRDWRIFKEDFNISTKGGNIPNPLRKWSECKEFPEKINKIIQDIGYKEPTPIQKQAIPISLTRRDLIGIAETGSGKTASFILPMLVGIIQLPPFNIDTMLDGPYGLVLAPTRELAIQIQSEANKFAAPLKFSVISIVGGHSIKDQAFGMRNGAHIIIATPGRLKDCLESRILALNQCCYIVLDEADRMIDMGFEADVNFILDALPSTYKKYEKDQNIDYTNPKGFRHMVMFSATMPPPVERIATKYLNKPAVVTIGNAGQVVDSVSQIVEICSDDTKKRKRLMDLLYSEDYTYPIIIFVNTKKYCDIISKEVSRAGHRSVILHGGKSQEQREASLAQLKNGEADILVATDVAGRGIDIKGVGLVINYDMAKSIEDYTHRIGRTGRAGAKGTAITFLNLTTDAEVLYDLRQTLLKKMTPSQLPTELNHCEAALSKPGTFVNKKRMDEVVYTA